MKTQTTNWLGSEVILIAGCEMCGELKPLTTVNAPDGDMFCFCDECKSEMEA